MFKRTYPKTVVKTQHILCECSSPEHTVVFSWATEKEDNELYIGFYWDGNSVPFRKRVWRAIKYIFGYGSGEFDGTIMYRETAEQLRNTLTEYLEDADVRMINDE